MPPNVELLTPEQAWTLLGIGKTQFYATIKAARPPLEGTRLPGMTDVRFRRDDLLSLPDRAEGSAIAAGFLVAKGFESMSVYEWKQNEKALRDQ